MPWWEDATVIDFIADYYAYWAIILLLVIGLYGMLMKRNLMKKLIGMIVFQNSIILLFVTAAFKWHATVPVREDGIDVSNTANYLNPLPHTLMLTAIVVGVATIGVAIAILRRIQAETGAIEERRGVGEEGD
jgi:multicomponent Na+:H+ antiporter subunit C